jgi:hypothetical protein
MAEKKRVEVHQLRLFMNLVPDFPDGRVSANEEPDFLITGPTSTVGIELTALYRQAASGAMPAQASEAMSQRTIERAGSIYAARGGEPVQCILTMTGAHIKKDEVETLGSIIADFVQMMIPAENTAVEIDDISSMPVIAPYVASLSIRRFGFMTKPFFGASGALWVPPLTQSDIAGVLLAKDPKHLAYRKKCDVVWLVIVIGYGATSTWYDAVKGIESFRFSTAFDRIYVLDGFGPKLHQLQKV